ncbi:MAG TPA: transposase, partial [Kiloniellales bacterium]|nr:transposase [Kiloniellales bacterium]
LDIAPSGAWPRWGRVSREEGSPWENGYNEPFNGKLRDEMLDGEIFYNLKEAQVLIEQWRRHYNTFRPHSSLGYRPPAPEAIRPHAADVPSAAQGLRADRRLRHDHSSLN